MKENCHVFDLVCMKIGRLHFKVVCVQGRWLEKRDTSVLVFHFTASTAKNRVSGHVFGVSYGIIRYCEGFQNLRTGECGVWKIREGLKKFVAPFSFFWIF
jgi:hypothetical protein